MSSSESSSSDSSILKKLRSGKWRGWFKDERFVEENEDGEKWDVEIKIRFHKDGHFTAKGSDDVGDFHFEDAKIDDDMKVTFLKVYSTHTVSYEGEVREERDIKGKWWLTDAPHVNGIFKMWNAAD